MKANVSKFMKLYTFIRGENLPYNSFFLWVSLVIDSGIPTNPNCNNYKDDSQERKEKNFDTLIFYFLTNLYL